MNYQTSPDKWIEEFSGMEDFNVLQKDFTLIDSPAFITASGQPFQATGMVIVIICTAGRMNGTINMNPFFTEGSGLLIILEDQVFQYESHSDDFSARLFIMSSKFAGDLFHSAQETLPAFLSIFDNPWIPFHREASDSLRYYIDFILKKAINLGNNPYLNQMVKHLVKALYYGAAGYYFHLAENEKNKTKHELLVDKFLKLVRENYKKHLCVKSYADILCITPKYLSRIVKENSGKSANEWIDEYILQEAKALLKSGNFTIQQVSDELNFPSQSFFGKYFKRHTGVMPSKYKKTNGIRSAITRAMAR
jgi:AraC-like DNA-binding protein